MNRYIGSVTEGAHMYCGNMWMMAFTWLYCFCAKYFD